MGVGRNVLEERGTSTRAFILLYWESRPILKKVHSSDPHERGCCWNRDSLEGESMESLTEENIEKKGSPR